MRAWAAALLLLAAATAREVVRLGYFTEGGAGGSYTITQNLKITPGLLFGLLFLAGLAPDRLVVGVFLGVPF